MTITQRSEDKFFLCPAFDLNGDFECFVIYYAELWLDSGEINYTFLNTLLLVFVVAEFEMFHGDKHPLPRGKVSPMLWLLVQPSMQRSVFEIYNVWWHFFFFLWEGCFWFFHNNCSFPFCYWCSFLFFICFCDDLVLRNWEFVFLIFEGHLCETVWFRFTSKVDIQGLLRLNATHFCSGSCNYFLFRFSY